MKHLDNFKKFGVKEHLYTKALAPKASKNWASNYESLLKHLTSQIEQRHVTEFTDESGIISFKIKGRKYKIDRNNKLFLYKKFKGEESEVELELTAEQLAELIKAFKKPLTSPKALDSTKKHPGGRKPYLD